MRNTIVNVRNTIVNDLKRWKAFRAEADPILDQYWVRWENGKKIIGSEEYSKWLKELEPILEKYFGIKGPLKK